MDYSVETLHKGTQVFISKTHRFGTDAMLLSAFCRPRRSESAVDLCSGCGIVALRWHDLGHRGPCRAVELFPEGTALLAKACQTDAALGHIQPETADLNDICADGTAHVVAANPPYFTGGIVSEKQHRAPARHEGPKGCTLDQVAATAARLLRDGGRFALCHRPDQLARICSVLCAHSLEPKRIAFAKQTAKSEPWLVLIEAQKARKPGLRYEADIYMADETGRPSAQLEQIYKEGM